MNIVILVGTLSGVPRRTELPSGAVLWSLDLTTPASSGVSASSVPTVWHGDLPNEAWNAGTSLAVVGTARRRFFRAGGVTQSRTEVVATAIIEVTKRRTIDTAVRLALRSLDADEASALRSTLTALVRG